MPETQPTTLFAVRHGETEWNRLGKQQGHLDTPLTDLGLRQARALAEGLAGQGIEAIYSSDLGRAMQTAQTIGERLGLAVVADVGLRGAPPRHYARPHPGRVPRPVPGRMGSLPFRRPRLRLPWRGERNAIPDASPAPPGWPDATRGSES